MKRFVNWAIISIGLMYVFTKPEQLTAQTSGSGYKNDTAEHFSWPLQLETRIPYEPTVFPSSQKFYLFYELYLTNFGSSPVSLEHIEVVDADKKETGSIATFDARQLQAMMAPLGETLPDSLGKLTIAGGQSAIIFMEVTMDRNIPLPNRIFHRLSTDKETLNCAIIKTHQTNLQLFRSPVKGKDWLAADGPGNDESNHHRRGVIILDGRAINSRRYAIDWKKVKDGTSFIGDSRNVNAYYCYSEPVYAVADGRVIGTKDGLPDNIPGHGDAFHPAVPITFETIAGNNIVIELGNTQFAYYLHLQPGSLLVKPGDRVKKGQLIARIGASGDAREPHLHFEVTTSSIFLRGEGVPYIIDHYRLAPAKNGFTSIHIHELPLNREIADF